MASEVDEDCRTLYYLHTATASEKAGGTGKDIADTHSCAHSSDTACCYSVVHIHSLAVLAHEAQHASPEYWTGDAVELCLVAQDVMSDVVEKLMSGSHRLVVARSCYSFLDDIRIHWEGHLGALVVVDNHQRRTFHCRVSVCHRLDSANCGQTAGHGTVGLDSTSLQVAQPHCRVAASLAFVASAAVDAVAVEAFHSSSHRVDQSLNLVPSNYCLESAVAPIAFVDSHRNVH